MFSERQALIFKTSHRDVLKINFVAFDRGTPSLAGRSPLENNPQGLFSIHPFAERLRGRISPPAGGDQRLCLWKPQAVLSLTSYSQRIRR